MTAGEPRIGLEISLRWSLDLPDPCSDGVPCCDGYAYLGASACTCWVAVYDQEQAEPREDLLSSAMPRPCHDCAYRKDVWARTVMSTTGAGGKPMPLDIYPDPTGNVAVRLGVDRRLRARVLAADENHDHHTEQLAMPHFATCGKGAR